MHSNGGCVIAVKSEGTFRCFVYRCDVIYTVSNVGILV